MKTRILIALFAFILSLPSTAQIDRSKQPTPGPAPAINLGKPQTFTLPNGLKVMVVEDRKLPRVSINLTMDNGLIAKDEKSGIDGILSEMLGKGSQTISKDDYNEEIDFLGATIEFTSNGFYAYSLSKNFDRVLELAAEGLLKPNFTQEELDKEKDIAIEGLKAEEKSAAAINRRVTSVLAFGKNHPYGEYTTEVSLKGITLGDIQNYYTTYFVPGNAYLVIIGDVSFEEAKKAVEERFQLWRKAKAPTVSFSDPKNVQFTQINLVDVPNAVQAEVAFINTARLSMKDKDYFAVLMANEILGGSFDSYLNKTLREEKAWTYGASSGIRGSKFITSFRAGASLKQTALDSAVVEIMSQIKKIRTEPVSDDDLKNAKANYIGNFVRQFAKPESVSSYALTIETQGLPADFYENYLKNINAVTKADITRVANKYFMLDNARIVISAKASEVADKLEATKIPVYYFDKFGNPTTKPEAKQVSADVTPVSVLDKYLDAIGGKKAAEGIQSVVTKASGVIQGTPLEMVSKVAQNKMQVEMKAMGMTVMKQVVNEKEAYLIQQGQRVDITGDDYQEMLALASPIKEIAMLQSSELQLKGIEDINGNEAYAVVDGKTTYYYDTKSGLKVGQSAEVEQMGQKMTQFTFYADYRDVKGIKVPHTTTINIGMELEFKASEVLVNEGITDADFK
jgi:predicted Zn-dependent peptidase